MGAASFTFDANETSDEFRVVGPCTIFVEGTIGGGTLSVTAARATGGTFIEINSLTAVGVFTDNIIGPHYIKATLTGATNPALVMAML
jgi:hypothetical protein